MSPPEPKLHISCAVNGDTMTLNYAIENTTSDPVLIFDRLYDRKRQTIDLHGAYLDIIEHCALFKRAMEILPFGLHVENPHVPYARELVPGATARGSITASLPLLEHAPYDYIIKRGWTQHEVGIQSVSLLLGWCVRPTLLPPISSPSIIEGEELMFLPYGLVKQKQQALSSASCSVHVSGVDFIAQ